MWFSSNNKQSETLYSTVQDVLLRLTALETKVKGLELENDDLRNKVLRKIQKRDNSPQVNAKIGQPIGRK